MGRDTFHQPRVLRAPSNLALNPAREGARCILTQPVRLFASLILKNPEQKSW